ncbi:hypothetical protein M3J09_009440 [Ascochyta lentis]
MMPECDLTCLFLDNGSVWPDAAPPGVAMLELNPTRSDKRGRRAGNDPATIPMPSSMRDQNPILPAAYTNSPGSLYSASDMLGTTAYVLTLRPTQG